MDAKEKMRLIINQVKEETQNRRYVYSDEPNTPKVRVALNSNCEDKEFLHAIVDLVTSNSYEELSEAQRVLRLVTIYDLEVKNGGHRQYFVNRGVGHLQELLEALSHIGAHEQHEILRAASETSMPERAKDVRGLSNYSAYAQNKNQYDYDERYYRCKQSVEELSVEFAKANIDQFVKFDS